MSNRNRIPAALEPYLLLPPELSLILLTGTLGCTPSWLIARFVSEFFNQNADLSPGGDAAVVLVSWMRDFRSWKDEIKRCTGVDLSKYANQDRFVFVDFLNDLPFPKSQRIAGEIEHRIANEIAKATCGNDRSVLLVLDSPDIMLALASASAYEMNRLVLNLRSKVKATIISCSADEPFVAAAMRSQEYRPTPIEIEAASFLAQQGHGSRFVVSTRELVTGAARDVSGVLRITRGGCARDLDDGDQENVNEMEALYVVQKDGNVKVFERGSMT